MTKNILIAVAVFVVLSGGFFIMNSGSDDTANTSDSAQTTAEDTKPVAATITYSSSGFSPSELTVNSGDVIEVKNEGSSALQFQSNPHPAHTDDKDLNTGSVSPGKSKKFTVTKTGTFGAHNHLKDSETITITVQ